MAEKFLVAKTAEQVKEEEKLKEKLAKEAAVAAAASASKSKNEQNNENDAGSSSTISQIPKSTTRRKVRFLHYEFFCV